MTESSPALTLFHHLRGNQLIRSQPDDAEQPQTIHPNKDQLVRRHALTPDQAFFVHFIWTKKTWCGRECGQSQDGDSSSDNVIIVPHMQITPNDSHLFNRAISSGGGILADLQRATIAAQAFYADNEQHQQKTARAPWILKRLTREIVRHAQRALENTSTEEDCEDVELIQYLTMQWVDIFPGAVHRLEVIERKRLQAVWELFHSELKFLFLQLLVLRNVYQEPLKRCQVEGCLLTVEPDLLFGNLEQLCRISRRFCHLFIALLAEMRTRTTEDEKNAGAKYNCTELVVELFEKFSKGPSTISAYQAYCINYKATMEYLASIRQRDERFAEFERVCLADARCHRLQLEDLLIAPLQRITRLPILLKEIHRHTADGDDRIRLERVMEMMHESLRSIDDSVQWLHNFERLQQLQSLVVWPSITELEPKSFIPDFLKVALSRQFCENLLAHPRRKLIYEGHLECIEGGKTTDCYAFLFNDMFLLTKARKSTSKSKKTAAQTKVENYIVQKQPVPLDSCVFCDAEYNDSASSLRHAFVIIHLTRYYQVVSIYTLQAGNNREKELWIEKFQESIENYESIQLKDMLKCTPLFSSLSLRRCSHNTTPGSRQPSVHSTS